MATLPLDQCRVLPAPGSTELSLPLTFLDIHWFCFHPIQRLLFYDFPCSKVDFLDTLIPKLKQSLSLTLKHYAPLAGNLVCPFTSGKPISRYVVGDSVSFTIAESSCDFDYLIGNHARDSDIFYAFTPQLPPAVDESDYKLQPVLALQVTLFPDRGICIGFTNHHVIGDASSIVNFLKAWALIHKLDGDSELAEENLPFYDRSSIKDPLGIDTIFWNQVKKFVGRSPSLPIPTNKVRATYILYQGEIQKLKKFVLAKRPGFVHVSSFVVATAYVWTCLVKCESASGSEEKVADDEPELIGFPFDCRARLVPPVPANYFGNCLGILLATTVHSGMKGNEGFLIAAESIGEAIHREVHTKEEILKGAENWLVQFESLSGKRLFGVAGSPKFNLYEADFGWGKPKKHEAVSIDLDGSMSLCQSRDFKGGLEMGLSLPKNQNGCICSYFCQWS